MTKKILTLVLAAATVGSAFSIGPKHVLPSGNQFKTSLQAPAEFQVKKSNSLKTRAAVETLDFTLADDLYSAVGLNNITVGTVLYQAFVLSEDNANVFAGDEITGINITTGATRNNNSAGANKVTNIKLFISDGVGGDILYTQDAKLGTKQFTENRIALTTPYKIEAGKELMIGYSFEYPATNMLPMAIDGIPNDSPDGCWVGIEQDGTVQWMNFADQVGNLVMGCTIVGEAMPHNRVKLDEFYGPNYAEPGKDFTYKILVKNLSSSAVGSIEVEYSAGTGATKTATFNVGKEFVYNAYGIIEIDDLVCNDLGANIPVKIAVSKVDGNANECADNSVQTLITCLPKDEVFPRVTLVEDGTGTWCGFCPRGIVMMEYMKEKYPGQFACAGIHASNGGSQIDQMQVASTAEWRNKYPAIAGGYPCVFYNRSESSSASTYASLTAEVDDYVAQSVPSMMGFGEITYSIDENNTMTINVPVKTALDMTNTDNRYRLGFYLIQDGVGPYSQSNYYAKSYNYGLGAMGGWENKGKTVSTIYDDVVRLCVGGVAGVSGSIPAALEKGAEYTYTGTMPVSAVTSRAFRIIAYIMDNTAGEVVNAIEIEAENPNISGVGMINADSEVVSRKYYNLNGIEVSEPVNGIFVERSIYSNGTVKSSKVIK